MDRRRAITAAAAVSLTLMAAAGGIALSSEIVGAGHDDGVGNLSPLAVNDPLEPVATSIAGVGSSTSTVRSSTPTVRSTAPTVRSSSEAPITTSQASPSGGVDDRGGLTRGGADRDESRTEDRDDDRTEHRGDNDEDREREYEGADDDD